ncbi:MAG: FAD-dependent oxidoreductase [Gammaproteobacteria bacterium PRO9]|nr:FAD-dependent oxidoreductase [Gammaproteobacteria bacterium PRO9]
MAGRAGRVVIAMLSAAIALAGCRSIRPGGMEADLIVIGAGIGGLAAAMEAEGRGARVLVIDANSVAGGHAVRAAGFTLVGTPLQQARGVQDSPDLAFGDLMAWGEDADAWWVRYYVENSRVQVHDWLASMGVHFALLLPTAEDSVPRFHMTRGAAIGAVVPIMREAFGRRHIAYRFNTEVTAIVPGDGWVEVRTRQLRNGATRILRAPAVVIATGGYQNSLELVQGNWHPGVRRPERLLLGAGHFATGSGLALAEHAGAAITRLDHQVTFVNGLPDPRDPRGAHGLLVQNPAAIWVDATGRRFVNEAGPGKVTDRVVLEKTPATHWLVFDSVGLKQLTIRGTAWLTPQTVKAEILDNPALVRKAGSIAQLAVAAGLPASELERTVQRFNGFVDRGKDEDFGRLGPGMRMPPPAVRQPPFYAIQLYPMTRQSMGGISVDHDTRVLSRATGQPLTGLYAVGEVTGVAGLNGSFGGSGGFMGPSLLMGRMAGRQAALQVLGPRADRVEPPVARPAKPVAAAPPEAWPSTGSAIELPTLLRTPRPGYWHFEVSHALVVERGEACAGCHRGPWQPGPTETQAARLVQLESCTRCH